MVKYWILRLLAAFVLFDKSVVSKNATGTGLAIYSSSIKRLSARVIHEANFHMHKLEHLYIENAPNLEHVVIEDLGKMTSLESLSIKGAPNLYLIGTLPKMPELAVLTITTSGLIEVPNLSRLRDKVNGSSERAMIIELEANHIRRIPEFAFWGVEARDVTLSYNLIEEIPAHAFRNARIGKLSLKGNIKLKKIDENAFAGIESLRTLDLSRTSIVTLPYIGLERLQELTIQNTPSLKYIPSIHDLGGLQIAELTHHFHCCAFAFPARHRPQRHAEYEQQLATQAEECAKQRKNIEERRLKRSLDEIIAAGNRFKRWNYTEDSNESESLSEEDYDYPASTEAYSSKEYLEFGFHQAPANRTGQERPTDLCDRNFSFTQRNIICSPKPDDLNPCEDVMGMTWLRISVWIVITAAVIGNLAVLIVLLAHRAELTVPRFLMCHLAFSDLCTGVYLFMIAVVDLRSYGEFFNYAYDWQYGVGCKVAGFFSVFSGQLSVITLTIVTLERWFAITYAIYLERRISLLASAKIMVGGWMFSILMAGLPLAGVSDYSSTSICLPVESSGVGDAVYQGSLFMTSAIAWVTIVGCYVQIYRSLGGGGEKYGGRGAAAAAEKRIANKMALLIGTNLLCWAPVAFFGITALAGVPLVDVSHGKVLLVFFYPLNAVANPFLYAILTKQYRRDLMMLVARTGMCNWLVERYKLKYTPPATAQTHPSAPPLIPLVESQEYPRELTHLKSNGISLVA